MRTVVMGMLVLLAGAILGAPSAQARDVLKRSTLIKKVRTAVQLRGIPVNRWSHTLHKQRRGTSVKRFTSRSLSPRDTRNKAVVRGTVNVRTGKVKVTRVTDHVRRTGKRGGLDAFWSGIRPRPRRKPKVDPLDSFWD